MDVLMLSTAIAALAVAMLVLACAISVCTIVLREQGPDSVVGPDADADAAPSADKGLECVVAMGPEPEAEPYSDSREGSFTLPLPPGFGMNTARLF